MLSVQELFDNMNISMEGMKEKVLFQTVSLRTDVNGEAEIKVGPFNGFLLLARLPKRLDSTIVEIWPDKLEDVRFKIQSTERDSFRLKMDSVDFDGNVVQMPEDVPVDGEVNVKVTRAYPDTDFNVMLAFRV